MLRGIRKASGNWLGRAVMGVVLGLIAVSFAIWGIGDIFRGFGRSTVAKVGSTEITVEQFRQIYNDRLQQLGRQTGRPISQAQAQMLRLDQQLAEQLVAEASLDQHARKLRLNLSDAEVARQIMADSNFKGANGQFDRARFEQLIRSAGYTETRFAAEQKRVTLRREIAETVGGDMLTPKTMADAYNRYENEQRAIDYVTLDRERAGEIEPPTPEVIAKYFESNKQRFRASEYRSIVILSVTPADIARAADVTEADARKAYEANRLRFGSPERRHVQQMSFPTLEEAQAAATRLEKTEITFEALAAKRGLAETDTDLGLVTKTGIIDRAIADAAFALPEGAISPPVKGTFGTVLVRVDKIEPENIKPYEEVEPQLKQMLANDRARGELASRHDKIEDDRAAGLRLTEIATKLSLTARTIEAIDRQGRDLDGQSITGLPSGVDMLGSAFGSDVGVENEPLQLTGGGYVWYEVAGVTRARERTLDEVRPQVEESWRNDQVAERLKAKTDAMIEKLKAGTPLTEVAAPEDVPVKTTFGIKRAGNTSTVSPRMVEAVFRTPKDSFGSTESTPGEWTVFHVTDTSVPEIDMASEEGRKIEAGLKRSFTEDIVGQYVLRLRSDIGTTINQDALRRVSSGSSNDQN